MFRSKKKTMIIGGVVTALLATSVIAVKAHRGGDRSEHMVERVSDHLELDASQQDAMTSVANAYRDMRADTPDLMIDLSGKLTELAADDNLTVEDVNQIRDQIKAEFDNRVDALVPQLVAFYNTLNEEQRGIVTARLEGMSDRFEQRLERRAESETNN